MVLPVNEGRRSSAGNVFIPLLLCLTVLFCTSCEKKQKISGPPEKLRIAYTTTTTASLAYIAFTNGYFAQEGLDAEAQPHAFGKLALNAVIAGKADLATVADTPFVFAVLNGSKITALAVIQTSNRNEGIIARRDLGIAEPADLRGKKIGVTLGTSGDFFADVFLLNHGIERQNVKIIDMKPDEMSAAIATGRVDAVAAFYPTLKQIEKNLKTNGTVFFGEALYTEDYIVAAGQDYVRNHPESMKKVLRALIRAETFARHNPEEARRRVADFLKIDKALVDEIWPFIKARVTLDQALLVDLEEQTRWALGRKPAIRTEMPNYLDFISTDGLLAVKPEAVRIIR
jgi:ABC-type nitrate/sulfonate/bicarbonate transport system substrate-binding protein